MSYLTGSSALVVNGFRWQWTTPRDRGSLSVPFSLVPSSRLLLETHGYRGVWWDRPSMLALLGNSPPRKESISGRAEAPVTASGLGSILAEHMKEASQLCLTRTEPCDLAPTLHKPEATVFVHSPSTLKVATEGSEV